MPMNTRARIATVCQAQRLYRSVEENRGHVLGLLDQVLRQNPDMVCLPETFPTAAASSGDALANAESVPGPTTDAVAERARRHHCYIVCPLLTQRDGRVYNSAVILDRSGSILGIYDKRRPVTSTCDYTVFEQGVSPGASAGVFDLDFGRVGIRICFDIGFPEEWEEMARQEARLVLWPSAYNGGAPLSLYAALHRYYVVTSVRTDRSRIIDPCGTTLAETDRLTNVICRDINLDFAVCHYDFNFGIPDRILTDYGPQVDVRSHVDSGLFLVEPTDPAITTAHLMAQYGFETTQMYHRRHREAYAAMTEGGVSPVRQRAAHGDRSMWAKG